MRLGKARPAEAFGREEKPAGMFPREEEARDCAGKGSFCRLAGKKGRDGGRAGWEGFACRLGVRGNRRGFPGEKGAGLCREGAFCRLAGKKGRSRGSRCLGRQCLPFGRARKAAGRFQWSGRPELRREGGLLPFGGEEGVRRGSRCLGRLRLPSGRVRKAAGDFQGRKARDCVGKGPFAVWRGRRGVAGDALLGKASPAVWACAGTGGDFQGREARDCAGKGPKKGSFCRLAGKKGRSRGSRWLGRQCLPFGRARKAAGRFQWSGRPELRRKGVLLPFGGEEGAWRGTRRLGRLRLPFGRCGNRRGIFKGSGRPGWR